MAAFNEPKVTLNEIFHSPRLIGFFRGFLVTINGLENYLFWCELQQLKKEYEESSDKALLRINSWILYEEFLEPDSTFEIPIPLHQRKKIFDQINEDRVSIDSFDEIEADIIFCLQTECVPKFKSSEWFQRYQDQDVSPPELEEHQVGILSQSSRALNIPSIINTQTEFFEKINQVETDYREKIRFLIHWVKPELEGENVKKDDLLLLFGNLDQIYELHYHISIELLPDIPIHTTFQKAIFERHFFDIYRKYLCSLPFARLMYEVLHEADTLKDKFSSLEKSSNSKFGQSIVELLFESPRAHLKILQDNFDQLVKPHQQSSSLRLSSSLRRSLASSSHLMNILHELMHLSENPPSASDRKLFELRETLVGYPGNLTKYEREYIKEGHLSIEIENTPTPFYCFLFNDKLVCTTALEGKQKNKFKFVNFYPLINASVELGSKNMVKIINAGPDDLPILTTSSDEQKEWFEDLNRVTTNWREQFQKQEDSKEKGLRDLVDHMKKEIPLKDQGRMFKTYKACFTGTECVYFFIQRVSGCNTKKEAEALANQLLKAKLIVSCSNSTEFKQKNGFYRFGE